MNEVIKSLTEHRSIRKYTDEPIGTEQIDTIIKAAQAAPSSIGGQQVTIIAVQDRQRKAKMAELAGGQSYIDQAPLFLLFCADFQRAAVACEINGQVLQVQHCMESVLVGSVDVGLSMGFAIAAAESMQLGTVCIGAIRGSITEVANLMELPQYVFPVAGLVVGHPADWSRLKPRFPQSVVFHNERYDNNGVREKIEQYDKDYFGYVDQRGGDPHTWSSRIAATYNKTYYPDVAPLLKRQGFDFGESGHIN